ncbi:nuclear transport factor 2 family protein [Tissierella praeacuta]|nr:nuclear transport factor 2 family protein [Tissierella praeacuta]
MKKQIDFEVITMDIDRFFKAVLSQNEEELRKFFHKNAVIKWHCTNELFTLDEYIKANCEYPGNWNGEIERIEEKEDTIILACRVFLLDNSASFHVVSFIHLEDNLIIDMEEYWSDDGLAPEWRRKMKIGKRIR